jgi:hypothetical protein
MKRSTFNIQRPMPKWPVLVGVGLLLISGAATAQTNAPASAPASAPVRLDYNAFRTISDRNIFNPNRYARSSGRSPRTDSRSTARVESFTLVGLMAYEKGVFAFFDGTKSGYKQVLHGDGAISEFKVTGITPDQVRLVSGTNEFVLRVGTQVRREDEGDWFLADASESAARRRVVISRGRSGVTATTDAATGESGEINGTSEPEVIVIESGTSDSSENNGNGGVANGDTPRAENDAGTSGISDPVLLRLMQRRQELNQ